MRNHLGGFWDKWEHIECILCFSILGFAWIELVNFKKDWRSYFLWILRRGCWCLDWLLLFVNRKSIGLFFAVLVLLRRYLCHLEDQLCLKWRRLDIIFKRRKVKIWRINRIIRILGSLNERIYLKILFRNPFFFFLRFFLFKKIIK